MRRKLATLACLAAVASPASAAEFVPAMESFGAWDSNVFGSSRNEESAFSTIVGPDLVLREQQGSLRYNLEYKMHYEAYPSISGINNFQHFVDATASYQFSARTEFSVREYFSHANSVVQILNSSLPQTSGLLQSGEKSGLEEVQYNRVGATFTHMLTPRWQLQLSFDDTRSDFPKNNDFNLAQFNSHSMVGSAQITNAFSARTTVGFGSSVTRQDFSQNGVSGRGATFYQVFGILNYRFTPTITFSASAGPALDDPDSLNTPTQQFLTSAYPTINGNLVDASTCPFQGSFRVFDPSHPNRCQSIQGAFVGSNVPLTQASFLGTNDNVQPSVTYYGQFSLTKYWETVTATLSYDRSAATASGFGTSTNVDSFGASIVWTPTNQWRVSVNGYVNRQTSASKSQQPLVAVAPTTFCDGFSIGGACFGTEIANVAQTVGLTSKPVSNGIEIFTYRVGLDVTRRLSKRLTAIGRADWWRQDDKNSIGGAQSNVQNFRFLLGFSYTLDPIPLWTKDL